MNNTLKWVMIAGAAYLVYKYLADQGILGGAPAVEDAAVNGEAGNGVSTVANKETLRLKALQSMPAEWDGKLNADQWNYYYTAVSGVQQTVELHPPDDRGYKMTVDEYFGRRAEKGLSGMGRLSPLAWMT